MIVLHKGDCSQPFQRPDEIKGDVYKVKTFFMQDGWEQLVHHTAVEIEKSGFNENKFLVSTFNSTYKD